MCSLDDLVDKLKKAPTSEVVAAWRRWLSNPAMPSEVWTEELTRMNWTWEEWNSFLSGNHDRR